MLIRYRNFAFGAVAATIFLSGCGNSMEDTQNALTSTEEKQEMTVQELNQLIELESQVQPAFEAAFSENEDLSAFADGSSGVHANIEERRGSLETLDTIEEELSEQHETFAEIEIEEVSEEATGSVADALDSLTGSLDEFTTVYEEDLSSQTAFFESLAQEDATHETLREGVETINSGRENTEALMMDLDAQIVSLEEARQNLSAQLDEMADG